MSDLLTVYVSIGNSDDKLSQARWRKFWLLVRAAVTEAAAEVHGEWMSSPVSQYQNACIGFTVHTADATRLKDLLAGLAGDFGQDSIAWAEANVEFLVPA